MLFFKVLYLDTGLPIDHRVGLSQARRVGRISGGRSDRSIGVRLYSGCAPHLNRLCSAAKIGGSKLSIARARVLAIGNRLASFAM